MPYSQSRRAILCLALAPLLFLLGWAAGYLAAHGISARRHITRLETLARAPRSELLTVAGLAQAQHEFRGLQGDLAAFRPLTTVGPPLGWLPWVGPTMRASPYLLEMATASAAAGESACRGAQPIIFALAGENAAASSGERLAAALAQSRLPLDTAQSALELAEAARIRFRADDLLPPLQEGVSRADRLLSGLRTGLRLVEPLPVLLGQPQPRTYLLVAQNNDHLRASGGLIVGLGTLTIDQGKVTGFQFEDSSRVDNWDVGHPAPPKPLQRFMGLELWSLADAGWWPDFTVSAQAMLDLYALNRGVRADGVIAIDLPALALIVDAVGPLHVAEYGDMLDGTNVIDRMRAYWSPPHSAQGMRGLQITAHKPFSALLVRAYYQRQPGTAWFDDLALLDAGGRNLLRNPSFEEDLDGDRMPDGWQGVELGPEDGQDGQQHHSGCFAVVLRGDGQSHKALVQRVERSGAAGEVFYLGGWGRVEAPGTGVYGLEVTVEYADGTSATFALPLPRREGEWYDSAAWLRLSEWWGHRAEFTGVVARALLAHLQHSPAGFYPDRVVQALWRGLAERHIQVYFADEALQTWLAEQGWDGSLPPTPGDSLLVVDSNVGRNKVNPHVSSHIDYRLTLTGDGGGQAELAITYRNNSPPVPHGCQQTPPYTPSYAEATTGCYWDYVRVYAPEGSRLIAVAGADQVSDPAAESARTVFGAFFVLAPGEARTLRFTYTLPSGLIYRGGPYTLWARKQAGTTATPITVEIVPPSSQTGLLPASQPGEAVRFESSLQTDQWFSLPWR